MRRLAPLLLILSASTTGAACVSSVPERSTDRAVYLDARKAVEVEEGFGWVVDRHEIEEVAPRAAESVCTASPQARLGAIRWIEARIEAEGGPAREAWERRGRDKGAIRELLTLERTRDLIRYLSDHAEDDCPFWLEEDEDFSGVHADAHRLVIMAESLGGFRLVMRDGEAALGGGGAGRLLFGWGLDSRLTLAVGGELGGVAELTAHPDGGRTLVARFAGAVPVLLRIHDALRIMDIEFAPTARYGAGEVRPPGFRASVAGGISSLRVGGFMPHAMLWIGYEYQQPRDGDGAEHTVIVGTRFGVDWDP